MNRVLITGGADGLGWHLAQNLVKEGLHVTVLDVNQKDSSKNLSFISCDISKVELKDVQQWEDPFDVIICNAGISVSGDFAKIDDQKDREVLDVNLFGHMKLIKFLLAKNLIKEEGRIAFICSASVFLPFPIALAYSASKSALDGFAYALESYLIKKKISITRVYPGPMNTAHSQYYPGAQTEGGRLPQQSVPAILKGIMARKRKIYPDPLSKLYKALSFIIPHRLCHIVYNNYKERIT